MHASVHRAEALALVDGEVCGYCYEGFHPRFGCPCAQQARWEHESVLLIDWFDQVKDQLEPREAASILAAVNAADWRSALRTGVARSLNDEYAEHRAENAAMRSEHPQWHKPRSKPSGKSPEPI